MDIITFGTAIPGAKRALFRRLPGGGGGMAIFPDYVAVYQNGGLAIRSLDEVIGSTEEWEQKDSEPFRLELTRMGVVTAPFVPKDAEGYLAAAEDALEAVEPEDEEEEKVETDAKGEQSRSKVNKTPAGKAREADNKAV